MADDDRTTVRILVTGANSGLGFSLCCRLVDEFLFTRPPNQTLNLLFTTRDAKKSSQTLQRLNAHLQKTIRGPNGKTLGSSQALESRIKFEGVQVDLTKLLSVKKLANELLGRGQRLDAVVWNAGVAGWSGINLPKAVWFLTTSILQACTFPTFMVCNVGLMAKPQLPARHSTGVEEPKLGQVFLSNVFGHYMLTHWLAPLLDRQSRVIWMSSISALPHTLKPDEDIQGVRSDVAYEGSKRLTDYLVLTSDQPSTSPSTDTFFGRSEDKPSMYLVHPGVCGTAITNLPWLFTVFAAITFYLARWLGSPWQTIDPYKGAVSPAFACLAPEAQLGDLEKREGKGKWGSAINVWGDERVGRTETEGWGFCGKPDVVPSGSITSQAGRYQYAEPSTAESRVEFEATGRRAWQDMEELRVQWEGVLKDA